MRLQTVGFHELYTEHAEAVFRFAYWLSGNETDARDITSETFARVWTSDSELRVETLRAYLFATARNLHLKNVKRRLRHEPINEAIEDPSLRPDYLTEVRSELQATLAAVQSLPEIDRAVLMLRAHDDLPYEEIARITGLTLTTVKVKVFRARAKLESLLNQAKESK